jgi:hypothetical protein
MALNLNFYQAEIKNKAREREIQFRNDANYRLLQLESPSYRFGVWLVKQGERIIALYSQPEPTTLVNLICSPANAH